MPLMRGPLLPLLLTTFLAAPAAARWVPIGPDGGTVSALAVAPSARRTVYAATYDGLVFCSADAGASWSLAGPGLPSGSVATLVVDPRDASTLYAGLNGSTSKGGFRSVDGGRTWTSLGLPFTAVWSLAIDSRNPDVLLAGTGEGAFRSVDGGATWTLTGLVSAQFADVVAVAFDPGTPGRAWAAQAGGGGVFRSDDGGVTWTPRNNGLPGSGTAPSALAVDASSGIVYTGLAGLFGDPPLYRSTDGGATWAPVIPVEGTTVYALAVSSGPASTVYVSTPDGVFRGTDGGLSWSGPDSRAGLVLSFAVPPSPDATVYAGANALGVFKSTDRGVSWRPARRGLNAAGLQAFAVAPSAPSVIYASQTGRGVLRSTDGGTTWKEATDGIPPVLAPRVLRVNPLDPRTAYAADSYGRIWKTTNGGASWRFVSDDQTMGCMYTLDLAIDPVDPGNVYATGFKETACERQHEEGCLGFRSTDAGESWTCMKGGDAALAVDPRRPSTLFSGRFEQIFRSLDAGRTWKEVSGGFLQGTGGFVSALAVSPRAPEPVYAGTNLGVFQSMDGGSTWRPRNTGLPRRPSVYDLALSPSAPAVLYAAIQKYQPAFSRYSGSLYRTTDGAASWRQIPTDDLPRGLLVGMQVHPSRPDILFAAPIRGGLFRLTAAGGDAQ